MGLQRARRYMLTGDEFTAAEALEMGVVLEVVPDGELADRAMTLAQRVAQVPNSQLEMITWALNAVADEMYDPTSSRRLGTFFDGVARHTQEGLDFVSRSQEVGFREAVRERDRPFGDYGERSR
jgi:enoyl-CoA hydratase